jgi:hypothetical protein
MQAWTPAVESWIRAAIVGDRYLRDTSGGKICGVGFTQHLYVHSADNQLVRDFLADESATHMLHLESDMIIPDNTIELLLSVGKPVVSGLYFLRNGEGQPCLYRKVVSVKGGNPYMQSPVTLFPRDRPFRLDGCCGLGCVLIERRVFEQLEAPWFDLSDGRQGYGSDMFFYKKVRDAGLEVWVQPLVCCAQIDYTVASLRDYEERLEREPGFAASGVIIGMDMPS